MAGLESLPRWTASRLEGTGVPAMPFRVVRAFENLTFDQPLCLVAVPGGSRFVVMERGGSLWSFEGGAGVRARDLFLELNLLREGESPPGRPRGIALGFNFHRDFPEKPYVFVTYNQRGSGNGTNRVSRFRVSEFDPPVADPESEAVLFEWPSTGHSGSDLKFGRDGFLYISTGDGSSPGDPDNVGQTTDNLLGSILRIDVDAVRGGKHYAVPRDNPFVGIEGIRPEVWAYGLRNPWRMSFRPGTDELWLGDNGDEHWEMVHRVHKGANHGWSAFEGNHPFRLSNKLAGPTLVHTPPAVEHSHTEMRSVVGGFFYEGEKLTELAGFYLYGCYFTQKLWGFPMEGNEPGTPRRLADVGVPIASFAQDAAGEPLVVGLDGGIYRVEASDAGAEVLPIPGRLSETGLFASTGEHRLEEGFLPYSVNAPAWRDGASARRYLALADGEEKVQIQSISLGLSKEKREVLSSAAGLDRWRFPSGSAFVQTFSLGERRVETQVMYKEGGEWRFLTYAWNEGGTDAELVPEEGADGVIAVGGEERRWRFMARADCAACHTQRSMFALGTTMAQLNRDHDYSELGGAVGNQLATLDRLGFFSKSLSTAAKPWPVFVDPRDEGADLDARARTYLHVNCAPCHRETGLGGRADFQFLYWLTLEETGAVGQRPLVGLPGIEDARIIAPGDPDRSEVCRRMATKEAGKMPLVGSEVVDAEGLELLRRWIEGLPK